MEKIFLFDIPEKVVMDPVHGSINLFAHEVKVIDDPLFQRLRFIVQNDVLFFVFPGCSHNRFSHSLGTMHIAGRYFRKLTIEYLKKFAINKLSDEQSASIQYLYHCVRLAALLHDTGHSPFSHQFEFNEKVKEILSDRSFVAECFADIDVDTFFGGLPDHIDHEHFSVRTAVNILSKKVLPVDYADVIFFMGETQMKPSAKLLQHGNTFLSILFKTDFASSLDSSLVLSDVLTDFFSIFKNIISGELDADKMDYILRDSYHSGVNYGKYHLDHLLSNVRIGYRVNTDYKKIYGITFSIAIRENGLGALEDFVYARFQLYKELYNHKSVSGFRKLLSLALEECISRHAEQVKERLRSADGFMHFTDAFFWERFRDISIKDPASYSHKVLFRKKLKYHGLIQNRNEDYVRFKVRQDSLALKKEIVYWKSKIKFSSIDHFYNDIEVLCTDYEGKPVLKHITEVTDFFQKFSLTQMYHLFILIDEALPFNGFKANSKKQENVIEESSPQLNGVGQ